MYNNTIICNIYKQTFDDYKIINLGNIETDYLLIKCDDCYGSGIFYITELDKQKCNECKGSGQIYVNLT